MYRVPRFKPRRTDARMLTSLMMLAAEANGVVGLRMMKLVRGGNGARSEAERMVREKVDAALGATTSLMAGASGEKICRSISKTGCGECEAIEQGQFEKPKEKTAPKVVFASDCQSTRMLERENMAQ